MSASFIRRFIQFAGFAAGLLLLFAAVSKLRAGSVGAVQLPWLRDDSTAQLLMVATIESTLGLWLVSGWRPRGARWTGIVFFSFLAVISGQLIAAGQSHCGCFGRIPLRPEFALLLDVVVVGLLGVSVGREQAQRSSGICSAPTVRPLAKWLAGGIALVALAIASYMLATGQRLDDVIGRFRGESVTISPRIKELGDGAKNEMARYQISLTNHLPQAVTVIGSSANCSCAIDATLPFVIPPHASRMVPVAVRFAGSPGRFQQSFDLYLNSAEQTSLPVRFHGFVRPSPGPTTAENKR